MISINEHKMLNPFIDEFDCTGYRRQQDDKRVQSIQMTIAIAFVGSDKLSDMIADKLIATMGATKQESIDDSDKRGIREAVETYGKSLLIKTINKVFEKGAIVESYKDDAIQYIEQIA